MMADGADVVTSASHKRLNLKSGSLPLDNRDRQVGMLASSGGSSFHTLVLGVLELSFDGLGPYLMSEVGYYRSIP